MTFLKMVPVVLILLYVSLASIKIGFPGLQYDEILWGNAALGCIDRTFVTYQLGDVPVLLMPYIGAVKSYLYFPIFKLFGPSVHSIRIPMILMAAGSLFLLFSVLRQTLNQKMALVALFLFSLDPSFISQTRVDCGPIVIEFCCKVLALYLLLKLSNRLRYLYLFGLYLVLAVGVFNKLNFVWFVNSFFFALLVVYRKEIKAAVQAQSARQRLVFLLSNAAGCFVLYGYYLFISKTYDYTKPFVFPFTAARFSEIFPVFRDLITGVSFYDYALGSLHSPVNTVYFVLVMLLLGAGLLLCIANRNRSSLKDVVKPHAFCWLIFGTTLLQIVVTEQASANWHLFSLYPFVTILLATSVFIIIDHFRLEGRPLLLGAVALALAVTVYSAGIHVNYIRAYDQPAKNISWSSAIYELVDFTRNSPYRFVSVDWGSQAQLITLDPVKDKYYEICYGLDAMNADVPEGERAIVHWLLHQDNRFAFIMHPAKETSFTNPRQGMFYEAERSGKRLNLIKTISDGGRVIFEIYVPENKT